MSTSKSLEAVTPSAVVTGAVPRPRGEVTVPEPLIDLHPKATQPLSRRDAIRLTNSIRTTSEALYQLLARAHAGRAWEALSYGSFSEYIEAEFSMSRSRAYQLLDQNRVISALKGLMPDGAALPKQLNEAATRRLKPYIDEVVAYVHSESDGLADRGMVIDLVSSVLDMVSTPGSPGIPGLLAPNRSPSYSNLWFTPPEAVHAIARFLRPGARVWCPFDPPTGSHVVEVLTERGFDVTATHLADGGDFFNFRGRGVPQVDYLVSNPPWSERKAVISRCRELVREHGIRWALLLGETNIQTDNYDLFETASDRIQMLIMDKRVRYLRGGYDQPQGAAGANASVWLCEDVLPSQLTYTRLGDV